MILIELTRTTSSGGRSIWVNPDSIDYLSQVSVASNRPEPIATIVHFRSGDLEYVVETPEQIGVKLQPKQDRTPTVVELADGYQAAVAAGQIESLVQDNHFGENR